MLVAEAVLPYKACLIVGFSAFFGVLREMWVAADFNGVLPMAPSEHVPKTVISGYLPSRAKRPAFV